MKIQVPSGMICTVDDGASAIHFHEGCLGPISKHGLDMCPGIMRNCSSESQAVNHVVLAAVHVRVMVLVHIVMGKVVLGVTEIVIKVFFRCEQLGPNGNRLHRSEETGLERASPKALCVPSPKPQDRHQAEAGHEELQRQDLRGHLGLHPSQSELSPLLGIRLDQMPHICVFCCNSPSNEGRSAVYTRLSAL